MVHLVDPAYIAERLVAMEQAVAAWARSHPLRPEELEYLVCHEEFVAIAVASGRDHEVLSPAGEFITLPYWMQAWVLRKLGLECFIGHRLGEPN